MAEALSARGVDVHLYEMLPHVLQPFGRGRRQGRRGPPARAGGRTPPRYRVSGFVGDERVDGVALEDETVAADIAIVGVGVRPNAELAETAGIELGPTGAIATDEYGRTNYENVYAAGDNAEAMHVVTGEPDHVPLALTANRAGRAIGQTVTGDPTPVGEIAGTAIVKAFDPGPPERGSSTRNGLARPASIRFRSRFRRRRAPTTIPTARNLRSHWSPTARAANCSAAPSSAARARSASTLSRRR